MVSGCRVPLVLKSFAGKVLTCCWIEVYTVYKALQKDV